MLKKKVLFLIFISAVLYASGGSEIKPYKKTAIDVNEPSGLAYSVSEDCFLTVSDEDSAVYKFNRNGEIISIIDIDGYDLEGVAVSDDGTVFVVDEAYKEVISVDKEGRETGRFKLDIECSRNKGPEGICIDDENHLYIINEKNPGLVMVYDFSGKRINEYLPGAASDYSSICYDRQSRQFCLLSDEDRSLSFWHPESGISCRYMIDVRNPEGVVVGNDGQIYIISDSERVFYVFKPLKTSSDKK